MANGGHRHPTAAMVPPPRRHRIQRSANMLRNKSVLLKLEKNVFITIYEICNGMRHCSLMLHACVCRLRWLPVANLGKQKV
jgi:hypothetical protein